MRIKVSWWFSFLFIFVACTSAKKNDALLVQDRVLKLKPLSRWSPLECKVEASLTQPAVSRYRALFPHDEKQLQKSPWVYKWHARESSCEIAAEVSTSSTKNQESFLNTAVCLLLQAYWVNSPFDGLSVRPEGMVGEKDFVQLRTELPREDLGVYLPRDKFVVETHTKSRGVLTAEYAEKDGDWLPKRLEQRLGSTTFMIDEMEWEATGVAGLGSRRMLSSFWIFIGDGERPLRHSQALIHSCR